MIYFETVSSETIENIVGPYLICIFMLPPQKNPKWLPSLTMNDT
jgi:hypothetical protein